MTRHRWPKQPTVISPNKSERECLNGCGTIKVTRHEFAGPTEVSWTEYWRDLERVEVNGRVPMCEPVSETAAL